MTVTTDKHVYSKGEAVQINVSVTGPIGAMFSSTCQCYFVVEDMSDNVVYDMRYHYAWLTVLTYLITPAEFQFTWNQKDDAGTQVPVPGTYQIWGYVAGYNPMDPPRAWGSTNISIEEQIGSEETIFDLTLVTGWNLVSIPLVNHDYKASTLGLSPEDLVVRFDSTTQTYTAYHTGLPFTDFAIEGSTGYWIYSSTVRILTLHGSVPTDPQSRTITVPEGGGWALIGLTSLKTTWHASDIPLMYSGSIRLVAAYDPATQTYNAYYTGVPSTDYLLVPGQGYWGYCDDSGVLSYDP